MAVKHLLSLSKKRDRVLPNDALNINSNVVSKKGLEALNVIIDTTNFQRRSSNGQSSNGMSSGGNSTLLKLKRGLSNVASSNGMSSGGHSTRTTSVSSLMRLKGESLKAFQVVIMTMPSLHCLKYLVKVQLTVE